MGKLCCLRAFGGSAWIFQNVADDSKGKKLPVCPDMGTTATTTTATFQTTVSATRQRGDSSGGSLDFNAMITFTQCPLRNAGPTN